jgi:hypothetical protein
MYFIQFTTRLKKNKYKTIKLKRKQPEVQFNMKILDNKKYKILINKPLSLTFLSKKCT